MEINPFDSPETISRAQTIPEKEKTQIDWSMFEIVATLGEGAFGDVYKVKCLKSTKVSSDSTGDRVLMSQKSIKKQKVDVCKTPNQGNKTLLQDNFYVIKVVDVQSVPEEV